MAQAIEDSPAPARAIVGGNAEFLAWFERRAALL